MVWCLLLAVPVYGVSGTLVELLGSAHVHRAGSLSVSHDSADPMAGWVDMRRAAASVRTGPRVHSHAGLERHHHDRDDADVITLDGGAGDGGSSVESSAHVLAVGEVAAVAVPVGQRFVWPEPAGASASPWWADAPARPPRA